MRVFDFSIFFVFIFGVIFAAWLPGHCCMRERHRVSPVLLSMGFDLEPV